MPGLGSLAAFLVSPLQYMAGMTGPLHRTDQNLIDGGRNETEGQA